MNNGRNDVAGRLVIVDLQNIFTKIRLDGLNARSLKGSI